MSDLENKMEELMKLKPELELEEGLEDFQIESAKGFTRKLLQLNLGKNKSTIFRSLLTVKKEKTNKQKINN